jgi:hypothetical protein
MPVRGIVGGFGVEDDTGGAPLGDDLTCLVLSYRCATVTTARLTAPC